MEPWANRYKQERLNKKSLRRKLLEATIVIYAGFAIVLTSAIAECLTIPIAAKLKRHRERRQ